uniref:Uncharacterized protein n=1 Tax=Lepeophtheirus salmonis TaxID=72036 RepID=A0A0K2VEX6_LEPSM
MGTRPSVASWKPSLLPRGSTSMIRVDKTSY